MSNASTLMTLGLPVEMETGSEFLILISLTNLSFQKRKFLKKEERCQVSQRE